MSSKKSSDHEHEGEKKVGLFGKIFMRKKVSDSYGLQSFDKENGTTDNVEKTAPDGLQELGSEYSDPTKPPIALYEETGLLTNYVKGYTTPGPIERDESRKAKANLGTMLGVYLPTIQHILGVTMFIRLSWCVGVGGVGHTFLMLLVCCLATFLTCISLSAVATNGIIESGGAYFMISRNLGPEFGSSVGILFYLANTVASAMYLVGGIEILLLYICPWLTIGGTEVQTETRIFGMMSHNYRIYGTLLLIIEGLIVAMGVRFVQLMAPVSLCMVIISILACYAGGIEKTLNPDAGQHICMYDDHLLAAKNFLPPEASIIDICTYCNVSYEPFLNVLNNLSWTDFSMVRCQNGFPGFASDALIRNLAPVYPEQDHYLPEKIANKLYEVFQDHQVSFFHLLAIYFPAVTGILTGTNMSGDLANPQKSIPTGTIAAQLTTSFIYFSLALVFGAAISPELLRDKYGVALNGRMIVASLAWPSPWIVLIGAFLSTFGAALQCLCSAPRILQGIAKDDVIPVLQPFAKVTKKNEPFNGLLLTLVIAEFAILLGAVDTIAAVVDFFFLMCYAFVNVICFMHSVMGSPNWRPRYRYFHWSLALFGALLCFFIMFSTHWDYALLSCLLCFGIYKYVEWKGAKKEWGDGFRGLALTTAQYSLMKIDDDDVHPKNWRPQILVLHSMPWSKELVDVRYLNLINLASQLKAGRGLTIVVSFIRGQPNNTEDQASARQIRERMSSDMRNARLRGFAKTLLYNENQIAGSLHTLIQSIGIGGLRPNTLLLSWPTSCDPAQKDIVDSEYATFIEKLKTGISHNMSLIVAKGITDFPSKTRVSGNIDVYWIVQDGGIALLVGYLLHTNKTWRNCRIRVLCVATAMDNNVKIQENLRLYLYQLRINAQVEVIEFSDPHISKEAFERTLLMEERTKFLKQIRTGRSAPNENGSPDTDAEGDTTSERPVPSITSEADKDKLLKSLDRGKVHKMHAAIKLNELVRKNSPDSQLVLFNLPRPNTDDIESYMHYLEVLSDNLTRVLFVRGTGNEVITTLS